MLKLAHIDVETTGTDPQRHCIHQLAVILECGSETVELSYKMSPWRGAAIDPKALEVSGVTEEEIRGYPTPLSAFCDLTANLQQRCDKFDRRDKFTITGYNVQAFDVPFLRQFWLVNGDSYFGSFFYPNCLDVYILATAALINTRKTMVDFKLHTVARALDVEVDQSQLHQALYDVTLTRQMLAKLMNGRLN
jgi:DNA polymerase-3 subunit epsilon